MTRKDLLIIPAIGLVFLPRLILLVVSLFAVDSFADVVERIDRAADLVNDQETRDGLASRFEHISRQQFRSVDEMVDSLNDYYFLEVYDPMHITSWDYFKREYTETFSDLQKEGRISDVESHLKAVDAMARGLGQ